VRPAAVPDPIIAAALARSRAAADLIARGRAELRAALATARRHPDYARTERARRRRPGAPARETLTLAWWVFHSIKGVLEDAPVDEAADWIADDQHPERSLRNLIETEEREEAARAARTRRGAPARVTVAA